MNVIIIDQRITTMSKFRLTLLTAFLFATASEYKSQIVINEGCNKNFASITDEDGESEDWIELYNAGTEAVDLFGYALSDDVDIQDMWVLPHLILEPGAHQIIFCSGKNRYSAPSATMVVNTGAFVPQAGWNTHVFSSPFYWDGFSNVTVNTCSYSSLGYTTNSVFNQTIMPFNASISAYADGGDGACSALTGEVSTLRPNMQLNGIPIGTGTDQNCNTCYPAPYGNWYWGARAQMLILADELIEAGLSEGEITSIAFDVAYTDPVNYDYIEVHMNTTGINEMTNEYINQNGYLYHTNFGISGDGESIYLFDPNQNLASELFINPQYQDVSHGLYPDGSNLFVLFQTPTPGATNNNSEPADAYAEMPEFSINSGFFSSTLNVTIDNPNGAGSTIYYTTDGSEPDENSILYEGEPIFIFQSSVLRAKAYVANQIASDIANATYLINVDHTTPIISVTIDPDHLYGPEGNFDNPMENWLKPAYVQYFDSTQMHNLVLSQRSGMIQDGGWGGSRTQPQRSFRLELANGSLGEDPMIYNANPFRPFRNTWSDFYIRNGSNQYLTLPYKDAVQVRMMAGETNNYYSAWRPVSVYINGQYHGLYEQREKFNKEKFVFEDNATDSTIEILSLSAYGGFILRGVDGDPDNYFSDLQSLFELNESSSDYLEQADQFIDLKYYSDYIIGETWMGNYDWPGNNIKIYRSDATDYRWRFCIIDLELGMLPNAWSDCFSDNVSHVISHGADHPYVGAFNRFMDNNEFRNYYINRFADLMNYTYLPENLLEIENTYFEQMVTEMPNEYQRWGDPFNVAGWMNSFYENHLVFQSQLECRTEQVRNHLQNNYGLDNQVELTLEVQPEGAGRIQINTITPSELPWSGIYFDGVPVTITAIPNPGYEFSFWLSDITQTTPFGLPQMTVDLNSDDIFTAHFVGTEAPTNITISEINYNSEVTHPCGDWIEIHNYGPTSVNLTGWKITNENNQPPFMFPDGFVLDSDEYIVLAKEPEAFQTVYPSVENFMGPFQFTMSGNGGTIRLYDHNQSLYSSCTYTDSMPWPLIADGGGRTLELQDPTADLNDPANWFAGCMFGSPGEAFHACDEKIVFSEINYNSMPATNSGDWVEIRNIGENAVDISGWTFQDAEAENSFEMPASTSLNNGENLVICRSNALFESQYPEITNHLGSFDFGLDEINEMLRLYDQNGKLYFSMIYSSDSTWTQLPNGQGFTLELQDSLGNYNSASNWIEGCALGSPGEYFAPCEVVDNVSSFDDNENSIHVFPNPAADFVVVHISKDFTSKAQLRIFDGLGRVVSPQSINRSEFGFNVNISNLSEGWYIIEVEQDSIIKRNKFLHH